METKGDVGLEVWRRDNAREQDLQIELSNSWGGHRTGALGWPDLAMEVRVIYLRQMPPPCQRMT